MQYIGPKVPAGFFYLQKIYRRFVSITTINQSCEYKALEMCLPPATHPTQRKIKVLKGVSHEFYKVGVVIYHSKALFKA